MTSIDPLQPEKTASNWRFAPLILIVVSALTSTLGFGLCASSFNSSRGQFGAGMFFVGIGGLVVGVLWGIVRLFMK